jgi:hypothetical protein
MPKLRMIELFIRAVMLRRRRNLTSCHSSHSCAALGVSARRARSRSAAPSFQFFNRIGYKRS